MNQKEIVLAAMAAGGWNNGFSPIQIQKTVFLINEEAAEYIGGRCFDFASRHYGPFDQAVYSTLDNLESQGMVEQINAGRHRKFVLTKGGFDAGSKILDSLDPKPKNFFRNVAQWARSLSFQELVAAIYRKYPEMREISVIRS